MFSLLFALIVITSPAPSSHVVQTYQCIQCNLPLFSSAHLYASAEKNLHFSAPIDPKKVKIHAKNDLVCSHCGHFIGTLFYDDKSPSKKRFSIYLKNVKN